METSPSPLSPATFNGNGASPVPISAAPVDASSSMLAAWQLHAQQEEDSDLRNLLAMVRRRAWVIAGVAAVAMTLMTGQAINQEEIFEGQFRVLVEPVNAEDDFSDLTSILGEQVPTKSGLDYETQVQVLRSPELIEPLAEQLRQTYPELTYLKLLQNLKINRVGDTKILEVSYSGPDPVQIQVVLDRLSKTYLKYSLEERQTNLRQGINFVENQLPDLRAEVDSIQNRLESFRQQHNFITPDVHASQLSQQAGSLTEQRLELDRQMAVIGQTAQSLQDDSGTLGALEEAPIYQQLVSELRSVETKLAEELTRFSPDSLAIRVLEEQRANIVPLLQQEAQRVVGTKQAVAANEFQLANAQSDLLSSAEQQVAQGMSALPTLIRQYTDLQRELEIATDALSRFQVTRETLEIEAAQTEIPWQLIEVPVQETQPISPNLQRSLLMAFVVSLLAGLAAAMLLEKLDNVYHDIDELKAGTKLPVLGMLPFNRELRDGRTPEKGAITSLVDTISQIRIGKPQNDGYGYGNSESSFLEALRVLHTNIRMLSSDHPIRSIIVSSAMPGDGKSTVCANLAQVATAMGQRVLIVDVDLRKPQVHERLDIDNDLGLSNLIADDLPLKSAIKQLTPSGQLFVLTAGQIPPDPTKLLASRKMQQLMGTFERCFDLVIYDAPPTTGLADVSLIGQRTDGLVLVSRMGRTDRNVLKQTIETLKLAQITTLGVVANGIRSNRYSGYRYYNYGSDAANMLSSNVELASSIKPSTADLTSSDTSSTNHNDLSL
ncbi:MAG: polysaccharide biosynthesis tyrosine autokinase [Cyanobacteria bacterium J06623_4]